MKMLTLVCGEKIEEEIVVLLSESFLRSEVADKLGQYLGPAAGLTATSYI